MVTDRRIGVALMLIGAVAALSGLWAIWPALALAMAGVSLVALGLAFYVEVD